MNGLSTYDIIKKLNEWINEKKDRRISFVK